MIDLTNLWNKVNEDREAYSDAGHVGVVTYQITNNYDWYTLPSLVSLLRHNYVDKIIIMTDADELSYTVPSNVQIMNVKQIASKYVSSKSPNYNFFASYITLLRPSFCRILKEDKIINFDADTIINGNLQPFWEINLDGYYLAMVCETQVHRKLPQYTYPGKTTFNMGSTVMNLKAIREDNADEKWRWLVNNVQLPCAEQDSTILLFQDKICPVNEVYNLSTQTISENSILDVPVVIHYAGDSSKCYDDDYTDLFNKIYMDFYKLYIERYSGLTLKNGLPVGI